MKRTLKASAALLLAVTTALSLTACGGGTPSSSDASSSGTPSTPDTSSAAGTESTPSSDASGAVTLKVGASPAPHAEILEAVKPILAEQGITLEIIEFTDYVMPNMALTEGDLDANFFQHIPYLDEYNAKNGTDIANAASIHFEPMGVYPGKTAAMDALPDGAQVAIPNDPANEARALLLLQAQGLIKLRDGAGLESTPLDIVENAKNLQFVELEAAQIPGKLSDVDIGVINGNYAVGAKITDTLLVSEDASSEAANEFPNILAVRNGDESRPEIQALVAALTSGDVRNYINENYRGSVVPVF